MWGLGPLWSPVLFHDAATARLFLFYSESRKAYSPGGDIKYITSTDLGVTWSPPVTIHTHEADGEVPKVTVNRPAVDADGNWYLGFHSEPPESFKTFNEGTWCALQEAGDAVPKLTAPRTAAGQGVTTQAGVLTSTDGGATWDVAGHIEDPKTWLIDPAIECTSKGGLLALFRTGAGKIYASKSADKGKTWSKAAPLALPNPNSKFATITIDGQMLLVHNPSVKDRSSLSLALSVDEGRTWETLTVVDGGGAGADVKFTHPSITQWNDDTVKVAYTVWDRGLKLATIKLATVEG